MRLRTRILPAALAAATLLAACQPTPDAGKTADTATRPYGRIAFKPCVITNEQGLPPEEAQCASFPVAENPAQPDGRKIALNIAWLPADNKSGGTPDPVFFLAGGPGQSAVQVWPAIDGAFREVRKSRHIVLVDQRGTGKSNPLACKDTEGRNAYSDPDDLSEAAAAAFARDCAASLKADPRFYTPPTPCATWTACARRWARRRST